jgi:hypothetical protein
LACLISQERRTTFGNMVRSGRQLCEFRFPRRQRSLKIRLCCSLPGIETAFDLVYEHSAAPAMLNRSKKIPLPPWGRFYEIQDAKVVSPGNLSNNLSDKLLFRSYLCKRTHVE